MRMSAGPRGVRWFPAPLLRAALLGAAVVACRMPVPLTEARAPSAGQPIVSAEGEKPRAAADEEKIRVLLKDGPYDEATQLARAHLADVETKSGAESLPTADALDLLVETLRRSGKGHGADAQVFARRAVGLREKLGPDDLALARSRQQLASLLEASGDLDEARRLCDQVIEVRTAKLGRHRLVAESLGSLGNVLLKQDDYAGAKERYELSLEIQRETLPPNDPAIAKSLQRLGILLRTTSDFSGARQRFEEAMAIYDNGSLSNSDAASLLNGFAVFLELTGDIEGAVFRYRQALEMKREQFGARSPETALVMSNLANSLVGSGEYTEARQLLEEALDIEKETLPAGHTFIGSTQWNLGKL